jgi:uncharacterized protein
MGTNQYHEPANKLSAEIRTFARMSTGLIEEAEAIGLVRAKVVASKGQTGASNNGMDLEFLLRRKKEWRDILKAILFSDGDTSRQPKKRKAGQVAQLEPVCRKGILILSATRVFRLPAAAKEKAHKD